MNQRQVLLTATLSSVFTLLVVVGSLLLFSRAAAAPPAEPVDTPVQQSFVQKSYVSVSALAFLPTSQSTPLASRFFSTQLLALNTQNREFDALNNYFWAPLNLPDHSRLTGLTVFGSDSDSQGKIEVSFQRCDHSGNDGCLPLYEINNGTWSGGKFETREPMDTMVDNSRYTYYLGLRITALGNNPPSGLRSVRLEMENYPAQSGSAILNPLPKSPWSASSNYEEEVIIKRSSSTLVEICNTTGGKVEVYVDSKYLASITRKGNCILAEGRIFAALGQGTYQILW